MPDPEVAAGQLVRDFVAPPVQFRPTPLYWWSHGDLSLDKLNAHLSTLAAAGIGGTVVGYSHLPTNAVDASRPEPLTEAWWATFRAFVQASADRGMTVGFQEYVLLNHVLLKNGAGAPLSAGSLHEQSQRVAGGDHATVVPEAPTVCAVALPWRGAQRPMSLDEAINVRPEADGSISWVAPPGDWLLSIVTSQPPTLHGEPLAFDPLAVGAADHLIRHFYAVFRERLGTLFGTTFTTFFQDELDLGIRMPMWSAALADEFFSRKGYKLGFALPALWHDIGAQTSAIRIDYSDVVVQLLQERLFEPLYRWHEQHGTTVAMDQLGRGDLRVGRAYYGDYMRTMRWFAAPGNDDPHLDEPRNLYGFKVNSSIAHLYQRPTVWNEAFYGSGWGVTPAQVLAGVNEDFAYGVTHVSLHGLYYTTAAGWWEWASPDFHFRQPYWQHVDTLWAYIARVSFLLSQGSHRCDVAVLEPVTDLEADPEDGASTDAARAIVEGLVRAGCDADLVDFESLQRATFSGDELRVSGEVYRILIIPDCAVVRESTLDAAVAFARGGGVVFAYGRAPVATEAAPLGSASIARRHAQIADALAARGLSFVVGRTVGQLLELIGRAIEQDVTCDSRGVLCVHRVTAFSDIYFVTNTTAETLTPRLLLRAVGRATIWDAFTGTVRDAVAEADGRRTGVSLNLGPGEATCVVIGDQPDVPARSPGTLPGVTGNAPLDTEWTSSIIGTLDNTWADFAFPAGPLPVRQSLVAVRRGGEDGTWEMQHAGDGHRLWVLGPLPSGVDLAALEPALAQLERIHDGDMHTVNGIAYAWRPYRFSEQRGVTNDPLLRQWQTGPHGLKGQVSDEFIDVGPEQPDPALVGSHYFVWSTVRSDDATLSLRVGTRSAFALWADGLHVAAATEVPAAVLPPWQIPDYRVRTHEATLSCGPRTTLLARFTQSAGQRLRASLVANPPAHRSEGPQLCWWAGDKPALSFEPRPGEAAETEVAFVAPPGTLGVRVHSAAAARLTAGSRGSLTSRRAGNGWLHTIAIGGAGQPAATISLVMHEAAGRHDAGVLLGPLEFECTDGRITLGDWNAHGLGEHSGIVRYSTTVDLFEDPDMTILDLGDVSVTAAVRVNGSLAAHLIRAPYTVDVTALLRVGPNVIQVYVANTLANFYANFPSPYSREDQTRSGLFGPVVLRQCSDVPASRASRG